MQEIVKNGFEECKTEYLHKTKFPKQEHNRNNNYPLPESTNYLDHQIAGHFHGQGKTKLGMLKHSNGNVLKPLIYNDPRGVRELEFYEKVFHSCNNKEIAILQTFIPEFKGTWEATIDGSSIKYLCMSDITEMCKKPCILDVKIGSCTYDPEASAEKILQETIKYPISAIIGFRILGMRIFSHSVQEVLYLDKHYGKQQTPETIGDALFMYLNNSYENTVHAILCGFLHKLHLIENWFERQKSFAFYSSSLLFLYEGEQTVWEHWNKEVGKILKLTFTTNMMNDDNYIDNPKEILPKTTLPNENAFCFETANIASCPVCGLSLHICKKINGMNTGSFHLFDVRMIDFAHVFPSENVDQNYLFGLRKIIGYLKVLQARIWRDFS